MPYFTVKGKSYMISIFLVMMEKSKNCCVHVYSAPFAVIPSVKSSETSCL